MSFEVNIPLEPFEQNIVPADFARVQQNMPIVLHDKNLYIPVISTDELMDGAAMYGARLESDGDSLIFGIDLGVVKTFGIIHKYLASPLLQSPLISNEEGEGIRLSKSENPAIWTAHIPETPEWARLSKKDDKKELEDSFWLVEKLMQSFIIRAKKKLHP